MSKKIGLFWLRDDFRISKKLWACRGYKKSRAGSSFLSYIKIQV